VRIFEAISPRSIIILIFFTFFLGHCTKIRVGDIVECPCCAGNNVDTVISVNKDGTATVKNENNGDIGPIALTNLKKLKKPKKIENCVNGICKGDAVYISGSVGSGEKQVKVMQLFSNGTANVESLTGGEPATYNIKRLSKDHEIPMYADCSYPSPKSHLYKTCVGPTKDYTSCETYCAFIHKKCTPTCVSPAGRLNQSASAWNHGSYCNGQDVGGDVSCQFKFDDVMDAPPRWRCCCN
jgi:hypothetical protein